MARTTLDYVKWDELLSVDGLFSIEKNRPCKEPHFGSNSCNSTLLWAGNRWFLLGDTFRCFQVLQCFASHRCWIHSMRILFRPTFSPFVCANQEVSSSCFRLIAPTCYFPMLSYSWYPLFWRNDDERSTMRRGRAFQVYVARTSAFNWCRVARIVSLPAAAFRGRATLVSTNMYANSVCAWSRFSGHTWSRFLVTIKAVQLCLSSWSAQVKRPPYFMLQLSLAVFVTAFSLQAVDLVQTLHRFPWDIESVFCSSCLNNTFRPMNHKVLENVSGITKSVGIT